MTDNGRVHPDCVNAANPYHECGVACLEKIAQGQGRKEKKKSDYQNGVSGGLSKKMDGERRADATCPKASNPYHQCDKLCSSRTAEASPWGVKKESGSILETSLSFGRKKKGSESQLKSPQVVNNGSAAKAVHSADNLTPRARDGSAARGVHSADNFTPRARDGSAARGVHSADNFTPRARDGSAARGVHSADNLAPRARDGSAAKAVHSADNLTPGSPLPIRKKLESENSQSSSSSSRQHSEENYSQDHSFDKGQIKSSEIVPASGNLTPNGSRSLPLGSFTCFAIAPPATKLEDNEKLHTSAEAVPSPTAKNVEFTNGVTDGFLNFTFSGISRVSEDSDDEVKSVFSDSCVSVGKYHVRANIASILQLILDKYGDIAANCKLESASLRAYYLECLCSVVQELQSASFNQLTKSKVKEFMAVLKDVESAQINVSWLRDILNGLTEVVELNNQQQATEEAKSKCNHVIESTKKELELMLEDLAQKEKAVADTKARIDETRGRLSELELESSQLNETISSLNSKVEKFQSKPLADQLL